MDPSELLLRLSRSLDELGLAYLVTGSVATIFYGEPRFTNDIDVVVDLSPQRVAEFCARFPAPEYYVDEAAVREAIATRGQFNILHPDSGLKIDVIIGGDGAFDRSRFGRARAERVHTDASVQFASPEDVIIK